MVGFKFFKVYLSNIGIEELDKIENKIIIIDSKLLEIDEQLIEE